MPLDLADAREIEAYDAESAAAAFAERNHANNDFADEATVTTLPKDGGWDEVEIWIVVVESREYFRAHRVF